jgi:protein O-GlcNAc transferase
MREGHLDRAIQYFQEALKCKPDYLPARVNLGAARAGKGDYASARREWEKALNFDPNFQPARENLEKLERFGY